MLFVTLLTLIATATSAQDYHTRGWVEHARIMPDRLLMSAKLDSGAQTTSIHAEILMRTRPDEVDEERTLASHLADTEDDARAMLSIAMMEGPAPDDPPAEDVEPMDEDIAAEDRPELVTFALTSRGGKKVVYTEPVVRWVAIRRRGGGSIARPVVLMELCVGGLRVQGEVNLADRSGFNYPLLIGRNMLRDAAISVDSRQVFAARRACPEDQ